MSGIITIVSVSVGMLFLGCYAFRAYKEKAAFNLVGCIEAFLLGYGSVSGLFLLLCAFYPPLFASLNEKEIYHAVSGITILYITFSGILHVFGNLKKYNKD